MDEQCSCEDLLSVIEDFIPMLIDFLSLFIFDLATLGFSIEYLPALAHIWNCVCDDDV